MQKSRSRQRGKRLRRRRGARRCRLECHNKLDALEKLCAELDSPVIFLLDEVDFFDRAIGGGGGGAGAGADSKASG